MRSGGLHAVAPHFFKKSKIKPKLLRYLYIFST